MDGNQNGQWPNQHHSPLRQRILQESRLEAQGFRRRPQQKHYRAPNFPGTAAFDLMNGLSEMPHAKRKHTAASQSPPIHVEHAPAFTEDELLNMSSNDYHATIWQELDSIEQASRSNTLSPSLPPSADSMLGDRSDTLSVGMTEPTSHHAIIQVPHPQPYYENFSASVPPAPRTSHTLPLESKPRPEVLVEQPPARPISEQQLIAEVKGIYAGLVMVEEKCVKIVEEQQKLSRKLDDQQFKSLVGLHRALLQEHHDFFLAVQHPSASLALKLLATKYAMPHHMWHKSMYQILELFRRRSLDSGRHMALFGDICGEMMQEFTENIPQLSHEWDLIKDNLREYFTALRADGFSIPSLLLDRWDREETSSTQLRRAHFPPLQGHFFGDDGLADEFARSHMPYGIWESLEEMDDGSFCGDSVQGTAQLMMAGWVQYGRKIATSYHGYCQVAIFLAVTAFTASLVSW